MKHRKNDIAQKMKVTVISTSIVKYLVGHEDLPLKERMIKLIIHSYSTREDQLDILH